MTLLSQMAKFALSPLDNPDEDLNKLIVDYRKALIEAYISIIHGIQCMQGKNQKMQVRVDQYGKDMFSFVENLVLAITQSNFYLD